jgi:hypothetical protein
MATNKNRAAPDKDFLVGRAELMFALSISTSRVSQIVREKIIPEPDAHGKYPLLACIRRFVQYQRAGGERSKTQTDFTEARTAWMQQRAAKAALEREMLERALVRTDDMVQLARPCMIAARQRLLAVPPQIGSRWSSFKTPQDAVAFVERAVHEALNEIASMDFMAIAKSIGNGTNEL